MDPDVTRRIAKLQYAAARLPLTLLDQGVVTRYWDRDATIRVGFERWLGSLDLLAGRLLGDNEISRRGQALIERSREPAQAGGNAMSAPVQAVHSGQVPPDPQAADGQRWENDRRADRYVPNPLGSTDSVVVVEWPASDQVPEALPAADVPAALPAGDRAPKPAPRPPAGGPAGAGGAGGR